MIAVRRHLVLASPLIVIAAGHLTAQAVKSLEGHARWVPVILVLWTAMLLFTRFGTESHARRAWFAPSMGNIGWRVLAVLVGLMPLWVFLRFAGVLAPADIWVPWLLFGLVNPFVEEMYWRGSVLTAASSWPRLLAVAYVSVVFAASHPLVLGVFSHANRTIEVTISTFVMGIVWAVVFLKTRSLRWPVFSHFLVDMLALSVATFLNVFVPPRRP